MFEKRVTMTSLAKYQPSFSIILIIYLTFIIKMLQIFNSLALTHKENAKMISHARGACTSG
jgi:hypothetical protein